MDPEEGNEGEAKDEEGGSEGREPGDEQPEGDSVGTEGDSVETEVAESSGEGTDLSGEAEWTDQSGEAEGTEEGTEQSGEGPGQYDPTETGTLKSEEGTIQSEDDLDLTEEDLEPTEDGTKALEGGSGEYEYAEEEIEDGAEKPEGDAEKTEGEQASLAHTESVPSEEGAADEEVQEEEEVVYESDDYISGPLMSEDSTIPEDVLVFYYSFGYECTRLSNLACLDSDTLLYASGNLLHFYDHVTNSFTFRRTAMGGGIGHIAVHPLEPLFCVAEKGDYPPIIIYQWPEVEILKVLRRGTAQAYAYVCFSEDGVYLCSQGCQPDFLLTVWNWRKERILLRCKAHGQDIFRSTFSAYNPGQLTTCGLGHIKFWKMAHTFTGLKLQGELGRFGRTEISDVESYVEFPDGKVISGCEWGNMLVWEGGLIKVEIHQKNAKACHQGPISQMVLEEGNLITLGKDGWIYAWSFESVDQADAKDDSGKITLEPTNDVRVGAGAILRSMVKQPVSSDEYSEMTESYWYLQDSSGSIWKSDLSFAPTSRGPVKLHKWLPGSIAGLATSPNCTLLAALGREGHFFVYDYETPSTMLSTRYAGSGSYLMWFPLDVDQTGSTLVAGFTDGVVRVLSLHVEGKKVCVTLTQALKPHKSTVSGALINHTGNIFITASTDKTIFLFYIESKAGIRLRPYCYLTLDSAVMSLQWCPFQHQTFLMILEKGALMEASFPDVSKVDSKQTFFLKHLEGYTYKFQSIKSRLRREEEKKKKEEEKEKKREEKEKLRAQLRAQGFDDEEEEEEEEEDEDEEEDPYIPEVPSPILHLQYSSDEEERDCMWVSMGEFDAGYMYKCKRGELEPVDAIPIVDSNDVPIHSMIQSPDSKFVIMGMENGQIRVLLQSFGDWDFSNYWTLSMHDNEHGAVKFLVFSHDGKRMFSGGEDGSIFCYRYSGNLKPDKEGEKEGEGEEELGIDKSLILMDKMSVASLESYIPKRAHEVLPPEPLKEKAIDIEDPKYPCIEDAKQKAEQDRKMRIAEEKKNAMRRELNRYRRELKQLIIKNETEIPLSYQVPRCEFEMHPSIREVLFKRLLDEESLVREKLAYELEKTQRGLDKLWGFFKGRLDCDRIILKGLSRSVMVSTFKHNSLSLLYDELLALNEEEMRREFEANRFRQDSDDLTHGGEEGTEEDVDEDANRISEKMIQALHDKKLPARLAMVLEKALKNMKLRAIRKKLWRTLYSQRPKEHVDDPAEVVLLQQCINTIGDYKLKTAADYKVPSNSNYSARMKRHELMSLKQSMQTDRRNFNDKLLALRDRKISELIVLHRLQEEMSELHENLEPSKRKSVPVFMDMEGCEMPEKTFEVPEMTIVTLKDEVLLLKQDEWDKRKTTHYSTEERTHMAGGRRASSLRGSRDTSDNVDLDAEPWRLDTLEASKVNLSKMDLLRAGEVSFHKKSSILEESESKEDHSLGTIRRGSTPDNLAPPASFEVELAKMWEIRVLFRQDEIIELMDKMILEFDQDVLRLKMEKVPLEVDLRFQEFCLLCLFNQLTVLKNYEQQEVSLTERLNSRFADRNDMKYKALEIQSKIDAKKKEMDRIVETQKSIMQQLIFSIGENNKFADFLLRLFKKKVKKKKEKEEGEESSSEESESESSSESEYDEEDEEGDEDAPAVSKLDDSECPKGCDPELYDLTNKLRMDRQTLEEQMVEEKKATEQLKKDMDTLLKKQKNVETALTYVKQEIEAFQLEKQGRLNALDTIAILHMSQVEYMCGNQIKDDLTNSLVFTREGLQKLQDRIWELREETEDERKKHVNYRETQRQFRRWCNDMTLRVHDLEQEVQEAMMSKLGHMVSLRDLELVSLNEPLHEKEVQMQDVLRKQFKEKTELEKKYRETRRELSLSVQENTEKLELTAFLQGRRRELMEMETNAEKDRIEELVLAAREEEAIQEIAKLTKVSHRQRYQMRQLRKGIRACSLKAGPLYLPGIMKPDQQEPPDDEAIKDDLDSGSVMYLVRPIVGPRVAAAKISGSKLSLPVTAKGSEQMSVVGKVTGSIKPPPSQRSLLVKLGSDPRTGSKTFVTNKKRSSQT